MKEHVKFTYLLYGETFEKKKMIQEHGGKQTEAIKDPENKSKP